MTKRWGLLRFAGPGRFSGDETAGGRRVATSAVFALNGVLLATWASRIVTFRALHGLGESRLGLTLLAFPAGAVLAMPLAGVLTDRLGSRAVTVVAGALMALTLPLPLVAGPLALAVVGLFGLGATSGSMDVAMNVHAVAVEAGFGRPILSSFHGWFSVGGFVGAALGWLLLRAGVGPTAHGLIVALAGLALVAATARRLGPGSPRAPASVPARPGRRPVRLARPTRALAVLAVTVAAVLLVEGAMLDWSALFLRRQRGASEATAALGYGGFAGAMAAVRLAGDRIVARLGPRRLVAVGGCLGAAGLTLVLVPGHPLAAVVGFGVVGVALANLVPVLFGAAGNQPDVAAGPGVAFVATIGYLGLLGGPPIIGLVAGATSLSWGLSLALAACSAVGWAARTAAGRAALARPLRPAEQG